MYSHLNVKIRTESNNSEIFMQRDHTEDINQIITANLYLYKPGKALRPPGS